MIFLFLSAESNKKINKSSFSTKNVEKLWIKIGMKPITWQNLKSFIRLPIFIALKKANNIEILRVYPAMRLWFLGLRAERSWIINNLHVSIPEDPRKKPFFAPDWPKILIRCPCWGWCAGKGASLHIIFYMPFNLPATFLPFTFSMCSLMNKILKILQILRKRLGSFHLNPWNSWPRSSASDPESLHGVEYYLSKISIFFLTILYVVAYILRRTI